MKKKSEYKLVRKVLIIAILQDCICSLYAFLFYLLFSHAEYLFPDAKMLENIPQHLVRGDFAEDGAEVVEGLAEVFGEEVGSLAGGEGTFDVFEGFGRFHQGLVVP